MLIIINTIAPDLDVRAEQTAILFSLIGYGIQAVIEGVLTVILISFLEIVKPEILKS